MNMEVRATEFIPIALDLTRPLPPLAFCLHSSFLSSHCSSCSFPLPHSSPNSDSTVLNYCSSLCSSLDSPLHFSSAELHLPSLPHSYPIDSSSLRLSLRLLYLLQIKACAFFTKERICGLLTNYEKLMTAEDGEDGIEDDDYGVLRTIKEGGRVLALARIMQNESGLGLNWDSDLTIAEAMMCLVMTNAVEVQDNSGRCIGIAVYDVGFSWINHSCSPNSCYRFSTRNDGKNGCTRRCRISSAAVHNGCKIEQVNNSEVAKFKSLPGNGPRIIVRSIKEIKKGEEITFAYTDLLRPKAIRQSELWFKYRFICLCKRCSAMPTPYVDSALQVSNPNVSNVETIKNLQDCFEAAIGEYLEYRNPVSCCEKLEKLVTLVYNESEMKSQSCLLNHLFLDAYTALASAYKLRAYELPVLKEAFEMSKASAAYSLLLAVMVHHLFLYETSFTVSALNFWFSAGESLLSLAKNSFWEPGISIFDPSSCYQTAQLNRLFLCPEEQTLELEEINTQLMKCAADDITNSWRFLTCGRGFLDEIKGLEIKCFWTKESCIGFQSNGYFNTSSMTLQDNTVRINLYNLGIHCLIHAAFLSCICYGRDSEVTCNVLSILVSEGVLATHPLLTC